jgi:hypothetical protein
LENGKDGGIVIMAVERADLSVSLSLERMAPVSVAPSVEGRPSPEGGPENGEDKPRRRPPRPEEASAEAAAENDDPPQHRVDSLA